MLIIILRISLCLCIILTSCFASDFHNNSIHVERYGSGNRTVILVHGGPSLYGYMKTLGNELVNQYSVIDYAQSGTFESPHFGNVTIDVHINDLIHLVDSNANNRKITIIGHSWGAIVALLAASRQSSHIEKLILIGTAPFNEDISIKQSTNLNQKYSEDVKMKLKKIDFTLKQKLTSEDINKLMEARLELISPFYHLNPQNHEFMPKTKWNFETFVQSMNSLWNLINSDEIPNILHNVEIPVVAFHGDSDPIPYKETFEFLKRNLQDVKTYKIKQSGHFPWIEPTSKDEFINLLKKELKR